MFVKRLAAALVVAGVLVTTGGVGAAAADDQELAKNQIFPEVALTGAGSTFACNFMELVRSDAAKLGLKVTYQCVGSGAGRSSFINGTVDFGLTDAPLSSSEQSQLAGNPYVQFSMVGGAIVVSYNPGSGIPNNIKLSADSVGKIFSGKIVKWNDPQLVSENPGTTLPDLAIRVAVRSDSSGTSNQFTSFMSATSTSWTGGTRNTFNSPPLPNFPGLLAANGNDGVANAVRDNPGMIGYNELSFAKERNLGIAEIGVPSGFHLPDAAAVQAALGSARLNGDGSLTYNFNSAPGYPISVTALMLGKQNNQDPKKAANLRALATLMLDDNAKANSIAYAPLDSNLQNFSRSQIPLMGPGTDQPATTTTTTTLATTTTAASGTAPATTAPATTAPPATAAPATAAPTTPITGTTSGPLVATGLALVAAGLGLALLSRKRWSNV